MLLLSHTGGSHSCVYLLHLEHSLPFLAYLFFLQMSSGSDRDDAGLVWSDPEPSDVDMNISDSSQEWHRLR